MLLQQRDVAARIAERFCNVAEAQRQGHVFEWMHELSFNLKAIAADDDARLWVTTWLGQPHDAADLQLFGPYGETLAEVQAKVVSGVAQRLAPVNGLSATKYEGMQLLVPQDHVASTKDLIDRRLAMPEGPLHERYTDVAARVTDRVQYGDLTSDPVTTAQLTDAARDPEGHVSGLIRQGRLKDVAVGGASAAAVAGLTTGLVDVATAYVRTGSLDDVAWPELARRAAQRALQAGAVAAIAEGISGAAQQASANGAGHWTESLVDGGLDFAMGTAVVELAGVALGVATGRLSAEEAAWAAAEALTKSLAGWACAAVGQCLIPIPVVGAVIGRVVGQYGAAMMIQGLRLAVLARDRSAAWDAEYEALLRHTAEMQAVAAAELHEVDELLAAYETGFRSHVLPRLRSLQGLVDTGHPDEVLEHLGALTRSYCGTPLFSSLAEFDALMVENTFTLVLSLNPR